MSKLVRVVQGLPPRPPLSMLAGWFVCGTALPWVSPKHHRWVEHASAGLGGTPILTCTRCDKQMGF